MDTTGSTPGDGTVRLFSYGTLRRAEVQRGNFGRELSGRPDHLVGYRLMTVEITDPAVIALSGSSRHPIVVFTGDPADRVPGTVFEMTEAELLAADEYEVDDYHRAEVDLASGTRSWVYLDKR
ncbi:MAG: gamma-glutamylcyclotransferase [Dactylosporangium sp.]|nr:gamma-glutamylcyclotransferase [Dactylosporangium sp.]NNJ62553.1 gamma-glutamylcyclotransferase [Dactylosporangium sp.]